MSSFRDKVLAYADRLARSTEGIPACDVAWRLRVIAGVLCSYGPECRQPPRDGYTMCERHVSQTAFENSWAPSGVTTRSEASQEGSS
jgi:hypothetical protein